MISNRQLFHEVREQEIQNESIEDTQDMIENIQDNLDYFLGGILSICETHKPKQNDN